MPADAMSFREYPIHAAVAPFAKCIWSVESDGPMTDVGREKILPDSCVELVFHFHDPRTQKLVLAQFHVEGFVNQYVLDSISADGRTIVFVTTAIENIPSGGAGERRTAS